MNKINYYLLGTLLTFSLYMNAAQALIVTCDRINLDDAVPMFADDFEASNHTMPATFSYNSSDNKFTPLFGEIDYAPQTYNGVLESAKGKFIMLKEHAKYPVRYTLERDDKVFHFKDKNGKSHTEHIEWSLKFSKTIDSGNYTSEVYLRNCKTQQ